MVKKLVSTIFGANCYIVNVDDGVIVIDPCVSIKDIEVAIDDKPILAIYITHGHADHFWGLKELADKYNVPIYIHRQGIEKIENWKHNYSFLIKKPFSIKLPHKCYVIVEEGMMTIGKQKIVIYHTPGHSDCSISILVDKFLFTGDTLFAGNVGRADLYSSDRAQLTNSLKKLKLLPNTTIVYPGHDESSTIGREKANNPYMMG